LPGHRPHTGPHGGPLDWHEDVGSAVFGFPGMLNCFSIFSLWHWGQSTFSPLNTSASKACSHS
jgi:hypothetical protein